MSIENAVLILMSSWWVYEVSHIFSSLILYSTIYICEFRSYLEPKLTIKQVQGYVVLPGFSLRSTPFDARF